MGRCHASACERAGLSRIMESELFCRKYKSVYSVKVAVSYLSKQILTRQLADCCPIAGIASLTSMTFFCGCLRNGGSSSWAGSRLILRFTADFTRSHNLVDLYATIIWAPQSPGLSLLSQA